MFWQNINNQTNESNKQWSEEPPWLDDDGRPERVDDSGRAPPTFNVHIARDCHGDARAEKPKAFNKSQT